MTDLSTQLLRFSQERREPALLKLTRELVTLARLRLEERPSTGSDGLPTICEEEETESEAEETRFIHAFLSAADTWYERYIEGTSAGCGEALRRWASFWTEIIPLLQSIRSMAVETPRMPTPMSEASLQRQFSVLAGGPLPPMSHI